MKLLRPLSIASCLVVLFGAGCGSPTGRVRVTSNSSGMTVAPGAGIEVFDVGEEPETAFREIAYLSSDGVMGDYLDILDQFKTKARELGADAIILQEPVTFTGERAPFEHLMFRATAIAYQNRSAQAQGEPAESHRTDREL
jgi:hypothetical protein